MVPFADNFTIGGVISLLIPGATLIAVAVWYTRTVLRRERERERLEEPSDRRPPAGRAAGGASQATP